jgi:lysozyme
MISHAAEQLLKELEGVELQVYRDVVGKRTIGVGHLILTPTDKNLTAVTGMPPLMVKSLTMDQVDRLLDLDLKIFEESVLDWVESANIYITQSQFDALVLFAFNLGLNALKNSTLFKKVLANDMKGAHNEFKKWVYAGGKVVKGLVERRFIEATIFASDFHSEYHTSNNNSARLLKEYFENLRGM